MHIVQCFEFYSSSCKWVLKFHAMTEEITREDIVLWYVVYMIESVYLIKILKGGSLKIIFKKRDVMVIQGSGMIN